MSSVKRGRRGTSERLLPIEESTIARAGEAATRLALEDTLVRRGWRMLFFDDQFGPMLGPARTKLFDGIAVRIRPGAEDSLELRLVRVESGTLEIPEATVERLRLAALSTSLEWLVAAFDGEVMRLIPDPDLPESLAPHTAADIVPAVVAVRPSATAAAASRAAGAPPPAGRSRAAARSRRDARPASRPRERRKPAGAAPPALLPDEARPLAASAPGAPQSITGASSIAGASSPGEAPKKPRRRGKRGGRRQRGARRPEAP